MASVTTMSGTRVTTMRMPLSAPSAKPSASTNGNDEQREFFAGAVHQHAAVTLVTAIIDATERSMPPAMTTIVCAATAKA